MLIWTLSSINLLPRVLGSRKPILTLPPIENKIISVKMTEPESSFYNACKSNAQLFMRVDRPLFSDVCYGRPIVLKKSQSVFDGYIKAGTASKSWFAIFSLLQRCVFYVLITR